MANPVTPNAGWPVYTLLSRWGRSGWSVLSGRSYQGCRSVLRGLSDAITEARADSKTSVKITVFQLAERAGLSERWTGYLLGYLEQIGLIVWWRGRIINGKPVPSRITIQRSRLAALVKDAVHVGDKKDREHVADVAARLAKMGTPRFMHKRRSSHVELDANPHPLRGIVAGPTGPRIQKPAHKTESTTTNNYEKHLPDTCNHLTKEPATCRHCKTIAITGLKAATGALRKASDQVEAAPTDFDLAALIAQTRLIARQGANRLRAQQ